MKIIYNYLQRLLPVGYVELEYIQSTGTQYISTVSAANKLFVLDMQFTSNASRQLMGISPSLSAYWGNNQGTWEKIGTTGVSKTTLDRVKVYYDVGNIVSQKTKTWLEGATNKFEGSDSNWASASVSTLKIFNLAGETYWGCSMKLFGLKAFNANDILLNNFIPCYRYSDGVEGLYDIVGKQFYTNQGTGRFIRGKEINSGNLLNLSKFVRGYPSNTGATASTKRIYEKNTYVLGLTRQNEYNNGTDTTVSINGQSITVTNTISYTAQYNGFVTDLKPNKTYTLYYSNNTTNQMVSAIYYGSDGTYIGFVDLIQGGTAGGTTITFTTNANMAQCLLMFRTADGVAGSITYSNIALHESAN